MYNKNYINRVFYVFDLGKRLDHAEIINPKLTKKLLDIYATKGMLQKLPTTSINVSNNNPTIKNNIFINETYYDEGKTFKFSLSNEKIVFETIKYTNFKPFKELIEKTIDVLFSEISSIQIIRTGLRIINVFNKGILDENFFVKPIIDHIEYYSTQENISKVLNKTEYIFDDCRLNFTYGFLNQDNKINKNSNYVLDFDCFTISSNMKKEEAKNILRILHDKIVEKFEENISQQLRKHLNE